MRCQWRAALSSELIPRYPSWMWTGFQRACLVLCATGLIWLTALRTGVLAQDAVEDTTRLCPLVSIELAHRIARAVDGQGVCDVTCRGCGCKGGPGYREIATDNCVGWADLIKKCGPEPHSLCKAECEPVSAGCPGRAWIKQLVRGDIPDVSFIPGQKRAKKEKKPEE